MPEITDDEFAQVRELLRPQTCDRLLMVEKAGITLQLARQLLPRGNEDDTQDVAVQLMHTPLANLRAIQVLLTGGRVDGFDVDEMTPPQPQQRGRYVADRLFTVREVLAEMGIVDISTPQQQRAADVALGSLNFSGDYWDYVQGFLNRTLTSNVTSRFPPAALQAWDRLIARRTAQLDKQQVKEMKPKTPPKSAFVHLMEEDEGEE